MEVVEKRFKEIPHGEAVKKYKALGLGYRALVSSSGCALGSVYKYMAGKMGVGPVRNRIHDALCRVLQVDGIIYPGE